MNAASCFWCSRSRQLSRKPGKRCTSEQEVALTSPMHQYFLLKFKRETEMERKKAIQTLSNRRRDKVKGRLAKKGRAGLVKFGQKSIGIVCLEGPEDGYRRGGSGRVDRGGRRRRRRGRAGLQNMYYSSVCNSAIMKLILIVMFCT